ncbi:hypothetical protein M9458_053172 [Cirrhinus mrigala]|uniref:Uncharacterized protein n=1 Tax=Cirrhinus mrigala TaxID=683832 RepID=A0ABD0MN42_CIRMR
MDDSENKDLELRLEASQNGTEEEELHRSGRQRNPTEKMRAYKEEEALKKEKRLIHLYEQWKDLSIAAKRADAAAELAAKEVEYSMIQEIEAQICELEKLKAEKDLKAARARLQAYDQEMAQDVSIHSSDSNRGGQQDVSITAQQHVIPSSIQCPINVTAARPTNITATSSPPKSDISYLAQAVQDSIALNRLPTTEPSVFNGDPIQFIEWKAAFVSLIDGKAISSAD